MVVISTGVCRVTSTVVKFFLYRKDSENVILMNSDFTNLHAFIHKRKYNQQFIILTSGYRHAFHITFRLWDESPITCGSSHKGSEMWHLMFSLFLTRTSCCTHSRDAGDLICVWINGWVNNREAGDLIRYRAHYDVTVMRGAAKLQVLNDWTVTYSFCWTRVDKWNKMLGFWPLFVPDEVKPDRPLIETMKWRCETRSFELATPVERFKLILKAILTMEKAALMK